jgi:lysophospholipase L1-like esterase
MIHKALRHLALSLVVALFAVSSAFAQANVSQSVAAMPDALKNVHRIVCLGDSITEQGEKPGGYVWLVRKSLTAAFPTAPIEVINAGISGHKSSDMLARFQRDVLDKKPDIVTISVGVNDVWHAFRDFAQNRNYPDGNLPNGVPLADYKKNVETMIQRAEAAKIRVVILSATPIYEDLDSPENRRLLRYNAALHDLARRHHCLFVDYTPSFQKLVRLYRAETGSTDNLLTTDGVHMNTAGNRLMARSLLLRLGVSKATLEAIRTAVESDGPK